MHDPTQCNGADLNNFWMLPTYLSEFRTREGTPADHGQGDSSGFSDKYLSTSFQQFATDVEGAFQHCGLNVEEFFSAACPVFQAGLDQEEAKPLLLQLRSVYIQLRTMGYSGKELTR